MFEPGNQQMVASLSDVAIEIFGAESAVLRAEKSRTTGGAHGRLVEGLARLAFARAADRVRQEASEVLAALSGEAQLRRRLGEIAAWLPLPAALVDVRTAVAETLLEHGGLPTVDLQPA
jgi:hypothetical protein